MNISIRALTYADIPDADRVICAAFRATDSRATELHRYLTLQSDGWFAAEIENKLVGTVGVVVYDTFAYLGLMAVDPAMHRQGIARKLMQHALSWLDERGCATVLLDASQYGAPLYASLGFVAEGQAMVFQNDAPKQSTELPNNVSRLREQDLPSLEQFDTPMFGASRANVFKAYLADFPERAFVARDDHGDITGFIFAQSHRIGPWVARDIETADKLLRAARTVTYGSNVSIIVPPLNMNANHLLVRYGFRFLRAQTHMRRGKTYPVRQRELIFGQASFAIG
jgi:predicted N-acetyltransferase YhbS